MTELMKVRNKYLFDLGKSWVSTSEGGELYNIAKPWGNFPTAKDNISFLSLSPENPSIEVFPDEIAKLDSLKALQIEVNFLPLSKIQLPPNLIAMVFCNLAREGKVSSTNMKDTPHKWQEDVLLEKLEYLEVRDRSGGGLWGAKHTNFPNLKWLSTTLLNPKTINIVQGFKNLDTLRLEDVGKVDVFKFLPDFDLKAIEIKHPLKGFDYTKIEQYKNLEIIWLWSSKEEIDCSVFLQFPKLKELYLPYCKKLINVEALLQIPTLISLNIQDAVGIPKDLKEKLKAKILACKV